MLRRFLPVLPALALLMASLITGCLFENRSLAGGGTDTESGGAKVVGRILTSGGSGGDCAVVSLRPKGFLKEPDPPWTSPGDWDVQADAEGFFAFDSVPPGDYLIVAECGGESMALMEATVTRHADSLTLEPAVLRNAGAVMGRVRLEDGSRGAPVVQVYGLERVVVGTSETGGFALGGLPPGTYTLRISSLAAFQEPVEIAGIKVAERETTQVGEIVLRPRLKQAFRTVEGVLDLPGVTAENPIINDNDRFDNTQDNDLLWAKASLGQADLRGNILQGHSSGHPDSFRVLHKASLLEFESARLAGMRNIPDPIPGAGNRLSLPASGNLDSVLPIRSPASALILAEARQASAGRPLLVFAGGRLTNAASAYLMDPAIAERMVVFGTFNNDRGDEDTLGLYIVAKKCRFVEWGRGYAWDPALPRISANLLPSSRYGRATWDRYSQAPSPFRFFGDLSGIGYLFDRKAFRHAQAALVVAPPFQVSLTAGARFDFVDIPLAATDFPALQEQLFATLADSAVYHPWRVPGRVEGEAYSGSGSGSGSDSGGSGIHVIVLDSSHGEAVAGLDGSGSGSGSNWVEYRIQADAPGAYSLEMRCRGNSPGNLSVTLPDGRTLARLDFLGGGGWSLSSADLRLEAGAVTLRIRPEAGDWEIDWLRLLRR